MLPNRFCGGDELKSKKIRIDKSQIAWQSMVLPSVIFLIVFNILPLFGLIVAFQDFKLSLGFFDSPWAQTEGVVDVFKHFKFFFADPAVWGVIRNTVIINVLGLVINFPLPIIFALLLNEMVSGKLKKGIQTVSYLPYFFSWIVFGTMFMKIINPTVGVPAAIARIFNVEAIDFINNPQYFYGVTVITSMIKGMGWSSIIYTAALTSTDVSLVEYAQLEGASRLQKWRYVYIPTISPAIVLYFIFAVGALFSSNFDQIYILKNDLNKSRAEVISTYVYDMGIGSGLFEISYSTAVGIMQSIISIILVLSTNRISKKITGKGVI